jgi:pimeloyl-ACP methyl ester carboxylesterase
MSTITTSDGVALHCTDDGEGVPVVLIAGFTAPLETWELQRRALLAAGFRVLRLDRRSHGRSDFPAYGHRMARHGKDVHDFGAVLVGGSMGASTIWAYHDLFGDERLRAVVSVDQTPKMVNDDSWSHGFYGLTSENVGTFFAGGIPATGHGLDPAESAARRGPLLEALGGKPPAGSDPRTPELRALLQDHAGQDWRDVVARLAVPSLFLAGRQSQFWPSEHATASAALNKLAEAVVLDDCGHAAHLDQADRVSAAIVDFLR